MIIHGNSFRSLATSHISSAESCTDLTAITTNNTQQSFAQKVIEPQRFLPSQFPTAVSCRRESKPELLKAPPPRPPRHSKSLGHIPKTLDQEKTPKRRRSASTCKSTHSLFECSESCFTVENVSKSGQFVTITTGPIVL